VSQGFIKNSHAERQTAKSDLIKDFDDSISLNYFGMSSIEGSLSFPTTLWSSSLTFCWISGNFIMYRRVNPMVLAVVSVPARKRSTHIAVSCSSFLRSIG
jgi:hypothetical protein